MFLKLLIQTCSLGGCRIQAATSGILSVLPNICRGSAMTLYTRRTYHQVTLHDEEIEEHFVKGWGKGGQKVNKTSNCVELCHKPTGTRVKCHKTRSLSRNRVLARQLLTAKLDLLYNGKDSTIAQEVAKKKKLKANYARKRRMKEMAHKTDESCSTTER